VATQPDVFIIPAIHVATLLITGVSALYVVRQRTTEYVQVKDLLVFVHIFFMGVVTLELLRYFITSSAFLTVYTVTGTTLVLADVFLLTLVALAVYYTPRGRALVDVFREVFKHSTQAIILVLYGVFILFAAGYLAIVRPFGPQTVPNLIGALQGLTSASCAETLQFGSCQVATLFNGPYLYVLLGILLIFMAYPSLLLYLARSRTKDEEVRAAFTVLPIAWTGIGLDLLFFNGYLLNKGIDASALGYLIAAAAFAVTASTFRRATLLSAFFQPAAVAPVVGPAPISTFSGRLGLEPEKVIGREFLLEVDPSVKYEESIRDLAEELGTKQYILFAFTSKGSRSTEPFRGLRT